MTSALHGQNGPAVPLYKCGAGGALESTSNTGMLLNLLHRCTAALAATGSTATAELMLPRLQRGCAAGVLGSCPVPQRRGRVLFAVAVIVFCLFVLASSLLLFVYYLSCNHCCLFVCDRVIVIVVSIGRSFGDCRHGCWCHGVCYGCCYCRRGCSLLLSSWLVL